MKHSVYQSIFLCGLVCVMAFGVAGASEKFVIAHRGASGYVPEHTLEAYAMAYAMGAGYIEQDLVLTKDDHFVSLHDIHLEGTTDVEERFPDRKREDGRWYAIDFTLAEIKTLRVHERLDHRFPKGKASFEVPTFEESIELIQGLNASTGKAVGIYPELKGPTWHRREGKPVEAAFLEVVRRYGYQGKDAKIFVQCFEAATLKELRNELNCELPMILLVSGGALSKSMITEKGFKKIAKLADGIGPDLRLIMKDPALVQRAHDQGLAVHPYTHRKDMMPPKYKSFEEFVRVFFFDYDVDAMFTDYPDLAFKVLEAGK